MNKRKLTIIMTSVIIVLDQLIKLLVINKDIVIIPNFVSFTYTENTGMAFNIGNNKLFLIILINIVILGLIFKFIKEQERQIDKNLLITLIFIFAGGLSNLIDRIFRGYVIDFIDVNIFNFPSFNIADICVVVGIFSLIFIILKSTFEKKEIGVNKNEI